MNSEQTKNSVLVASLLVNLAFAAAMIWLSVSSRQVILNILADAADARARVQKQVLAELESGDSDAIETLKQTLRFNIDVEQRTSYKVRTGDFSD
ncbi:MAG: hypothetical protein JXB04_12995 [Kiritimatiellae bacterium]|nr:hypothetical protein [Kiritimatiellia bacterium]